MLCQAKGGWFAEGEAKVNHCKAGDLWIQTQFWLPRGSQQGRDQNRPNHYSEPEGMHENGSGISTPEVSRSVLPLSSPHFTVPTELQTFKLSLEFEERGRQDKSSTCPEFWDQMTTIASKTIPLKIILNVHLSPLPLMHLTDPTPSPAHIPQPAPLSSKTPHKSHRTTEVPDPSFESSTIPFLKLLLLD